MNTLGAMNTLDQITLASGLLNLAEKGKANPPQDTIIAASLIALALNRIADTLYVIATEQHTVAAASACSLCGHELELRTGEDGGQAWRCPAES